MNKKKYWIQFGCFLTAYEFAIINECSAVSRKAVNKFTSALIIISLIWGFIGYSFCTKYITLGPIGGLIGSIAMIIIIIQIERQIILSIKPNIWLKIFRITIALLMAAIGSVIIDQILFKQDLENLKGNNKKSNISLNENIKSSDSSYNSILTSYRVQINTLSFDNSKLAKEIDNEGTNIQSKSTTTISKNLNDTTAKTTSTKEYSENPKFRVIEKNRILIDKYNRNIDSISTVQQAKRNELSRKIKPESEGFLNELDLMFNYIFIEANSKIPMIVWFFWLAFFLCIELFVLVTKSGEEKNDYEILVLYQMNAKIQKIKELEKLAMNHLES